MTENTKSASKIVIDASVALAFLLPDERKDKVDELFIKFRDGELKLIVPVIFYFEVLNGLKSAVLAKRISQKLAGDLVKKFLQLRIGLGQVNWLRTFDLALKYKFSFYDAAYLSLARKEKIPLLSLDKLLRGK